MRSKGFRQAAPAVFATVLVVLLVFLAGLQHRWLGQLSEGERGRAQAALEAAARQVAEGVDRQLTQLVLNFHDVPGSTSVELGPVLAQRAERWRVSADQPELLHRILLLRSAESGPVAEQLDFAGGELRPIAWPDELVSLRSGLEGLGRRRGERTRRLAGGREGLPVFVLPLVDTLLVNTRHVDTRRGGPGLRPNAAFLVLWVDQRVLLDLVLPDLVERHLAATVDGEYRVTVERRGDGQVLFTSGPAARRADVELGLFALLPPTRLREQLAQGERGRQGPPRTSTTGEPSRRRRGQQILSLAARSEAPRWQLAVTHPSGSLETAIDRARQRNLALSLAVLALLGLSALLLVASSRRAQRLARQRLEFVAGISHELMTPLAAMRSAGQNLADGVVREASKVERYGRLIDREGRRLSEMVSQVMEFAGMEAGGLDYRRTEVEPLQIIDAALADCRPALEDRGVELERQIPAELPSIWADGPALRRALQNLIANAVKYAGEAGWIGVAAKVRDGRELLLEIADRGPGIPAAEQRSIFEPFFRGRMAAAGATGGSGLGLSLVRHFAEGHGGDINLYSVPGEGSRFTLRLPLAAPETDHAD